MFEHETNSEGQDLLKARFSGLKGKLCASSELKSALKTGTPLRRGNRESTAVHVRRFGKAIVAYAVGVALFLGAVMMLPKWFGEGEPTPGGSVDPIITSKPIETTVPPVTEECKHLWVTSDNTPSCTEGCYKYTCCDLCGLSMTSWLDPLGHNYVDGICTRCGTLEGELPPDSDCIHDLNPIDCPYCACDGHSWSYSDSTATCTEDGIRERTCQKCGYVEIIEIEAYGHDYHFGTCSRCDDTLPPLEITIPIPDPGKMSAELEAEIIVASARQYNENAADFSIEFVADLGSGAYAIFLDGPWDYPCMETEQIVHGYLFWYSSGRTMLIYKDGAVYGLSKAYEQGVINAGQVLDLYLIYADQKGYLSVRNPEKKYSNETLEDNFTDNEIIIIVFEEYRDKEFIPEDFAEIDCIAVRSSGGCYRLLTLSENSKQNVLDCQSILEHRTDIYWAFPNLQLEIED